MCGIVAYLGREQAAPILINGLKKLEYRGYDSAGIAVLDNASLFVVRREGSVDRLEGAQTLRGNAGIGHTRWATHGAPSERNAHPHVYGKFAIVHNGIVENHLALRAACEARGEVFSSDTDSEAIAHLLNAEYRGDVGEAMRRTAAKIEGSFAVAVLCTDAPDEIWLMRRASPLVVGKREGDLFAASDVPAIAGKGMSIFCLNDGEFARLKGGEISFYGADGEIEKSPIVCDAETDVPEKKGYRHFMKKEMAEIPQVLANGADLRTESSFSNLNEVLCQTEYIQIFACGTAYHAGLCAKYAIERLARISVEATLASEYRYCDPIVKPHTLAVAVSQSGETADTLAAARLAKERGAVLLAVTNVPYSSLTALADHVLLTEAGREIAVAATKSFNAQLLALYRLCGALAGKKYDFSLLPSLASRAAEAGEAVRGWTPHFLGAKSVFFLGRGADYCAALEGSLKLKEISYLPSEGYAAGELKHGTLALVEPSTPVVAVVTSARLAEKTMNAVHEAYARGAKVFLITSIKPLCARKEITASVLLPDCGEVFSPILSVMPLQALAYYVSLARGNDPDKPRNLAKSVTVE